MQAEDVPVTTKMAHQCPVRGTCKYPNPGPFGNCWSRTTCRVWQNGPLAGRQQRPHRRLAAKNARPRSPPGQRRRRRRRARTRAGSGFPPRHRRAGRRGTAIPSAATDASSTTSMSSPTQPVLHHPPPRQVSLDSSSRLSSRSSNRSSNLNSSPSSSPSSSSRRPPREAGFSSQASPTSAGWLAAVGEAEADVEAPTRGAAAPGDAVSDSQGSGNRQSRQQRGGGSQNEGVPCSQTQGGPWDLAVHSSLGQFRRPCSTVRRRG